MLYTVSYDVLEIADDMISDIHELLKKSRVDNSYTKVIDTNLIRTSARVNPLVIKQQWTEFTHHGAVHDQR